MNLFLTAFTIGSTIYLMAELIILTLMCIQEKPSNHKPLLRYVNIGTKLKSITVFVPTLTIVAYLILGY